jgi:hypothetical protein
MPSLAVFHHDEPTLEFVGVAYRAVVISFVEVAKTSFNTTVASGKCPFFR